MKVAPSELKIANHRENEDVGIQALCESIKAVGQLQPVCVVDDGGDYRVIAGRRRVRACHLLGIDVRVSVCDQLDSAILQLKAERDENTCRAELLPSDKARLALELEKIERPKAEERSKAGKATPVQVEQGSAGRVTKKIADAVGVSEGTLHKLTTVAKAAEDPKVSNETREVAKAALKEMDRTGKVDAAFKKVRSQPEFKPVKAPAAPLALPEWKPLLDRFALELRAVLKLKPNDWAQVRDDLACLVEEVRPK